MATISLTKIVLQEQSKNAGPKIMVLGTYGNFCGAVLKIYHAQMYLTVEYFVN